MENILAKTGYTALSMLVAFFFSLLQVEAATFKVKCDKGRTIQKVLDRAKPGDVIEVSGTCKENLVIPEEVHSVTLDGQGTATIDGGPDATTDTVMINGKGITIKGFTITRGRNGIVVSTGEARIDDNTIQNTGGSGIFLNNHSFARIRDNMIKDNPNNGIQVTRGSTARIGFTGRFTAPNPRPNIITGNGSDGINVVENSFADMAFNTISGNTRRGIRVRRSSSARIGATSSGNDIEDNGREGIRVEQVSHAEITDNFIDDNDRDGILVQENSGVNISDNTGNNSGDGVDCRTGSYARGSIGTLDSGAFTNDSSCIIDL